MGNASSDSLCVRSVPKRDCDSSLYDGRSDSITNQNEKKQRSDGENEGVLADADVDHKELEAEWNPYKTSEDRPQSIEDMQSFAWPGGSLVIQRKAGLDQLKRFYVHFAEKDVRAPDHMATDLDTRWGRVQSHIRAVRHAKKMEWETVAIWEDDFRWIVSAKMLKTVSWVCSRIGFFDVIMLSASVRRRPEYEKDGFVWKSCPRGLRRIVDAEGMSAYIVHKRFYDRLLAVFEKVVTECGGRELKGTPHRCGRRCRGDKMWKSLQDKSHIWFALYPSMATRVDKASDRIESSKDRISEIFVDAEKTSRGVIGPPLDADSEGTGCRVM